MSVRRSTRARLPGRLLGAHVAERAGQVAGQRQPGVALHVGHAEVGDPEIAAPVQQQVGRLDVAVNDPLVVGIAERLGRLDAQAGDGAEIGSAADRRRCLRGRAGRRRAATRAGGDRCRHRGDGGREPAREQAQRPGALGLSPDELTGRLVTGRRARRSPRSSAIRSARLPPSMNCIAK